MKSFVKQNFLIWMLHVIQFFGFWLVVEGFGLENVYLVQVTNVFSIFVAYKGNMNSKWAFSQTTASSFHITTSKQEEVLTIYNLCGSHNVTLLFQK